MDYSDWHVTLNVHVLLCQHLESDLVDLVEFFGRRLSRIGDDLYLVHHNERPFSILVVHGCHGQSVPDRSFCTQLSSIFCLKEPRSERSRSILAITNVHDHWGVSILLANQVTPVLFAKSMIKIQFCLMTLLREKWLKYISERQEP